MLPRPIITTIVQALAGRRFDLADEKRAQAEIAAALHSAGIGYHREVRLAPGDVVDFLVGACPELAWRGVALEVKLRSARRAQIARQLRRYARSERVSAVLLATNTSIGLPDELEGKPAYVVSLGRAWL